MNFWEKNWDADHIKYINKAADIGFDVLEFQAQPLLEMSDARLAEIKSAADRRGILCQRPVLGKKSESSWRGKQCAFCKFTQKSSWFFFFSML